MARFLEGTPYFINLEEARVFLRKGCPICINFHQGRNMTAFREWTCEEIEVDRMRYNMNQGYIAIPDMEKVMFDSNGRLR